MLNLQRSGRTAICTALTSGLGCLPNLFAFIPIKLPCVLPTVLSEAKWMPPHRSHLYCYALLRTIMPLGVTIYWLHFRASFVWRLEKMAMHCDRPRLEQKSNFIFGAWNLRVAHVRVCPVREIPPPRADVWIPRMDAGMMRKSLNEAPVFSKLVNFLNDGNTFPIVHMPWTTGRSSVVPLTASKVN